MRNTELKTELLKELKSTLDSKSKWFNQDVKDFEDRLKLENDTEKLRTQLGNLRCLNGKSKSFNKKLAGFTKELDEAGMFNMGNMKVENALD